MNDPQNKPVPAGEADISLEMKGSLFRNILLSLARELDGLPLGGMVSIHTDDP